MKKIITLAVAIISALIFLAVTAFAQNEYVFDANDLNAIVSEKHSDINYSVINRDGTDYIRVTANKVRDKSNVYIRFELFDTVPLFNTDEFPYVAVSYNTNIPLSNARISINAGMKIDGTYVRCWGLHGSGTQIGNTKVVVYDVRGFGGTPDNGSVKYDSVDPSAGIKFIRIPPWADAANTSDSAVKDDYFDIESIGFFKKISDATTYFDDTVYTVTYYDREGNVYRQQKIKSYDTCEPIEGPEVEGLVFAGWENFSKTPVPNSFRIDSDHEFYPVYSRSLDYYVYPAGRLNLTGQKFTEQIELVQDNGTNWVRLIVDSDGVHNNTHAITLTPEDAVPAKEFKYFAVKYKSDISTAKRSALSPYLSYNGKYTKFWGIYPEFYGDSKEHIMVGCLENLLGGDAGVGFDSVDDDSQIQAIRFTPWGTPDQSIKIKAGEYIDIAYLAFFRTEKEAREFSLEKSYLYTDKPFMQMDSELKFYPDDNLTRGEAAIMITQLVADVNKIANLYSSEYTDIDRTDDCYSSVAYLEKIGYLKANGGKFNPDEDIRSSDLINLINLAAEDSEELSKAVSGDISTTYITRGKAAEVLCKLLGRKPTIDGIRYAVAPGPVDVPREHPQFEYILEACYEHNYTVDWDGTELWTYAKDNNFYIKKAPEGMIDELNNALAERAETILASESEWTVAPGGRVFYVSNKGSDSNDGLSQSSPIATIAKIHQMQTANTIKSGDVILFERGGEWYPAETLNDKGEIVQDKFKVKSGVTVSAYGTGDKPRILGSVNASGASNWSKVPGYDDLYVFNKKIGDDHDVGNIVFNDGTFTWEGDQPVYTNGSAYGMRLILDPWSEHALQAGHDGDSGNGDFIVSNGPSKWVFNTGDYIFEKSTDLQAIADAIPESDLWYHHNKEDSRVYLICKRGNPGEVFDRIDLCTKVHTVRVYSNTTLDNLCIKYTGSHGVGAGSCENLVVRNCEVGWIGGSIQGKELEGETGRFGNAIEVYGKADGFYVYNCFVYQCFDCGPTVQVGKETLTWNDPTIQKDVHFYGNALWNAALEVWLSTYEANFGDKLYAALINCKMYDNLVGFNGRGFQGYTHQKHDYCGFYGGGYTYADYIDCTIENNVFWNLRMNLLKCVPTSVNNGDGFYWRNNTVVHQYDHYLARLGDDTKNASGSSIRYYYNNATVKKLLSDGALGHNDFYYTLAKGADDPRESLDTNQNSVKGDINGDGERSPFDLIVLSRYLAAWNGYEDYIYGANSDLDSDNKLGTYDLIVLARNLAGWTGYDVLPIEKDD